MNCPPVGCAGQWPSTRWDGAVLRVGLGNARTWVSLLPKWRPAGHGTEGLRLMPVSSGFGLRVVGRLPGLGKAFCLLGLGRVWHIRFTLRWRWVRDVCNAREFRRLSSGPAFGGQAMSLSRRERRVPVVPVRPVGLRGAGVGRWRWREWRAPR